MTKRLITSLLTALITLQLSGQTLKWGALIQESKKIGFRDVIGKLGNITYIRSYDNSKKMHLIETLNEDLQTIEKKYISTALDGESTYLEYCILRNNELLIFSSLVNKKEKTNSLFLDRFNAKTFEPIGSKKTIEVMTYTGRSYYNSGDFSFDLSREEKCLLVYYNKNAPKGEKEKFGIHVYGNQNTEIWGKEITLPYLDDDYSINNFTVDDQANVFLTGKKFFLRDPKARAEKKPNYTIEILGYFNEGKTQKTYAPNIDQKFIKDIKLAVNDKSQLILAGFYGNSNVYQISGTFFMSISLETQQVIKTNLKEFGINFLSQDLTERQQERMKKRDDKGKDVDFYHYTIRDFLLTDDGGAIVVAEYFNYYTTVYTTTNSQGVTTTRTTRHYDYGDILVMNINPKGEFIWTEKIAKQQYSIDDSGYRASYLLSVSDNKMYFIFNDHKKNIFEPQQGLTRNYTLGKDGAVALVTMDTNGKQTRKSLFDIKSMETTIIFKESEQVNDSESILVGLGRKSKQFVSVKF
jgi:chemotaxis receptor (MCP) glutamine deamidase CheD